MKTISNYEKIVVSISLFVPLNSLVAALMLFYNPQTLLAQLQSTEAMLSLALIALINTKLSLNIKLFFIMSIGKIRLNYMFL